MSLACLGQGGSLEDDTSSHIEMERLEGKQSVETGQLKRRASCHEQEVSNPGHALEHEFNIQDQKSSIPEIMCGTLEPRASTPEQKSIVPDHSTFERRFSRHEQQACASGDLLRPLLERQASIGPYDIVHAPSLSRQSSRSHTWDIEDLVLTYKLSESSTGDSETLSLILQSSFCEEDYSEDEGWDIDTCKLL